MRIVISCNAVQVIPLNIIVVHNSLSYRRLCVTKHSSGPKKCFIDGICRHITFSEFIPLWFSVNFFQLTSLVEVRMMQMKISANQVSVRNGTVGDDCCPKEGIPICADTEMQSRSLFATSGTRGCAPQFIGTSAGHASASHPRRCRRKWQFIGTFRYS